MAYQMMADVYDRFMQGAPYEKWVHFTETIFARSGKRIETIADLGCGTGDIAIRLAKEGYQITGVDNAIEMLSHAEQKAREENVDIRWIHQDLRQLQGLADFDALISYCDVINYITSVEELETVFKHAANALKTGGLFLFDVHSLFHVEQNLINQTFAEVTDDSSYIWFCEQGDETGEMYHDLTFFMAEPSGNYKRFEEFHHQRTFSIPVYRRLLSEAGFKLTHIHGDFSPEITSFHEKTERIFIIAEKQSG